MRMGTILYALTRRLLVALSVMFALLTATSAADIREVNSPAGIRFWVVEDYAVPIVTLSFEFSGGANLDPSGKAGLSAVLAAMMDEGAAGLSAAAFKAELEARGIELGFSSGRDEFSGGMRVLASEVEGAFSLLAGVLNKPAFEEQALERIRAGFIQSLVRRKTDPRAILARTMRESLFSGHPYSLSPRGTERTLARITRQDVVEQHKRLLTRNNLTVGIVGAISPNEASVLIDTAFSQLPPGISRDPIEEADPKFGFRKSLTLDTPQTIVSIAFPGLKRSDPDFFAAYLMNHILGGGTFSSRLYNEIREKRGLVYSVGSNLRTLRYGAYISSGFATRHDQAGEALEILLTEIRELAEHGPGEDELEAARKFVMGAYAINNLDTSSKIASGLVHLQAEGLPIDYIEKRREFINAVTLDDVREIASRLLSVEPAIVVVGPEFGVLDAAAN